jgi:predicted RNA-binding Zn ribbon-like protein
MSAPFAPVAVDPELLPILGEPIAVEFANTLYRRPGAEFDFLDTGKWIVAWFDHANTASLGRLPRHINATQVRSIQALRNAVHTLFTASTGNQPPSAAAITVLNNAVGQAPCRVRLEWATGALPIATTTPVRRGVDSIVAAMAIECITFIASPSIAMLRRCNGPDCPMFFVQQHHKRRFCYDGCAHRARQSRYYRNHHQVAHTVAAEQPCQ